MSANPRRDPVRHFSRPTSELNVVLLEGVHESAVEALAEGAFVKLHRHAKALEGDDLLGAVCGAHYLGIRSRTRVTT